MARFTEVEGFVDQFEGHLKELRNRLDGIERFWRQGLPDLPHSRALALRELASQSDGLVGVARGLDRLLALAEARESRGPRRYPTDQSAGVR